MRRDGFEQVQTAKALGRDHVPKTIITTVPHDPIIAALDLVGCELDASVHVVEVILIGGVKAVASAAGQSGLVFHATHRRTWKDQQCEEGCDD